MKKWKLKAGTRWNGTEVESDVLDWLPEDFDPDDTTTEQDEELLEVAIEAMGFNWWLEEVKE